MSSKPKVKRNSKKKGKVSIPEYLREIAVPAKEQPKYCKKRSKGIPCGNKTTKSGHLHLILCKFHLRFHKQAYLKQQDQQMAEHKAYADATREMELAMRHRQLDFFREHNEQQRQFDEEKQRLQKALQALGQIRHASLLGCSSQPKFLTFSSTPVLTFESHQPTIEDLDQVSDDDNDDSTQEEEEEEEGDTKGIFTSD